MTQHLRLALCILLALGVAWAQPGDAAAQTAGPATIADVLAGNPELSILLDALERTGILGTLAGRGLNTLFAPTDQAFERLPPGQLDALLADEDLLAEFLNYHIIRTDNILIPGGIHTSNGSVNPIDEVLITPEALRAD